MLQLHKTQINPGVKKMIGRIAVKLVGREAGKECVIVEQINDSFVIIDCNLKRRKCNLQHLELTEKVLDLKKGASTEEVRVAMEKAKMKLTLRRPRTKEKVTSKEKNNGKSKK